MKIAVLSDIHGNSYALEEALKACKKSDVKKLLILGDFVGYYYHPERIFEMLQDWDYSFIKGNHENILKQLIAGKLNELELVKKYGSGHQIAAKKLSKKLIDELTNAPSSKVETIDEVKFSMYHGSPWDPNQYIYPDTDIITLEKCNEPDHEFVLIGHSHYSFIYRNRDSILINPGSVGQSKNLGGGADFVIINTINKVVEFKTVPYDISNLENEIDLINPEVIFLKSVLKRNRI